MYVQKLNTGEFGGNMNNILTRGSHSKNTKNTYCPTAETAKNVLRILSFSCKGPGRTAMHKYEQEWKERGCVIPY